VKLGVSDSSDAGAASAGVGYSKSQAIADYQAKESQLYNVGVSDLNAHGGLGGCPVSLTFFDFTTTSQTESYDQVSQQECVDFSQDQHVFAAVPETIEQWDLVPCLANAGIPVVIASQTIEGGFPATKSDYGSGDVYGPNAIAWDRLGGEITLLNQNSFFDAGSKVGIIEVNDGRGVDSNVVDNMWKPALASLNIPVVDPFSGPRFTSITDASVFAQDMNNTILQFKAAGVNHVLFAPGSGGYLYFFQLAADKQHYAPRIAIDTTDRPAQDVDAKSPSSTGMMAVSWDSIDYSAQATKPTDNPANAAKTKCDSLYSGPAAADKVPVEGLYGWCDTLDFLQAALGTSGGPPTAAKLQAGIAKLGTTYQSAAGFGPTSFSATVHDGATEARVMEWDPTITGFKYISPPEPIS
jgi:hypothetical protein